MTFDKFAYHRALQGTPLSPSEYRVLATLWDYSSADGTNAYPGNERLSRDCCLSISTVKRALRSLQKCGYVHQESRGGNRGVVAQASVYSLTLPTGHQRAIGNANGSPVNAQRVTSEPLGGVTHDPPTKHLTNHITNQSNTSDLGVQTLKRELRPEVRRLVDSLIPEFRHRAHLTNVAVEAMVELEDATMTTVEKALTKWNGDGEKQPGRLRTLIEGVLSKDPLPVIKRCIAANSVVPLRDFGFYYPEPQDAPTRCTHAELRAFMRNRRDTWLRQILAEHEADLRKSESA
jgi:hypothetical protein